MLRPSMLLTLLLSLICASLAMATVFTSDQNGDWDNPMVWDRLAVPGGADSVIIATDIVINATVEIAGLTIRPAGHLQNDDNHRTFKVHGDLINDGVITSNAWDLHLQIDGDLHNGGSITNRWLYFTGTGLEHHLTMTPQGITAPVNLDLVTDTGRLYIDSDVTLSTVTYLNDGTVELTGESELTLATGSLNEGTLEAGGNILSFADGPYLYYMTVFDPTIAGVARISQGCVFNGLTTVDGTLRNPEDHVILPINGDIINNGTITGVGWNFSLNVSGSVTNNGIWTNYALNFVGDDSDHSIAQAPGTRFAPAHLELEAGTEPLIVATDLTISSIVNLNGGVMDLAEGADINFDAFWVSNGRISAKGSTLEFTNNCYIYDLAIFKPVLKGVCRVGNNCQMILEVIVEGILRNIDDHVTLTIIGDIINNGTIEGKGWNLSILVEGNATNNGVWQNYALNFTGGLPHTISQAAGTVFAPTYLERTASTGSLIAGSPLVCATILLLDNGSLTLPTGTGLSLETGRLTDGWVYANGNSLIFTEATYLENITIYDGLYSGFTRISTGVTFTGVSINSGVLQNVSNHITLIVDGDLHNFGEIHGKGWNMVIDIDGDLENRGVWDNYATYLTGLGEQTVAVSDIAPISGYVYILSQLDGSGHQWYLNDLIVPGWTGSTLALTALNATHHGDLHCISSAGTSRTLHIIESGELSDVAAPPSQFALGQNYPNPFNPSTTINFALPRAAQVEMKIFNLQGEVVETLKSGRMEAGEHSVIWRGNDAASGVYLYRIIAGDHVETRRMTLLK